MLLKNGRKSSNLVKSHELTCHFIRSTLSLYRLNADVFYRLILYVMAFNAVVAFGLGYDLYLNFYGKL